MGGNVESNETGMNCDLEGNAEDLGANMEATSENSEPLAEEANETIESEASESGGRVRNGSDTDEAMTAPEARNRERGGGRRWPPRSQQPRTR